MTPLCRLHRKILNKSSFLSSLKHKQLKNIASEHKITLQNDLTLQLPLYGYSHISTFEIIIISYQKYKWV